MKTVKKAISLFLRNFETDTVIGKLNYSSKTYKTFYINYIKEKKKFSFNFLTIRNNYLKYLIRKNGLLLRTRKYYTEVPRSERNNLSPFSNVCSDENTLFKSVSK